MTASSNAEKAALGETAKTVAWGLSLTAATALAGSSLARNAIAAVGVEAAIAEWGTAQMGITWSDPNAPPPTLRAAGKRVAVGIGWGSTVAVAAIVAALVMHTAVLATGPRSPEVALVGLALAALAAVRDELLLRAVILRAARGVLPSWAGLIACAGAAACARFGLDGQVTFALAFAAARGMALGAFWIYDRGAFAAVGANVAFAWTTESLASGGVLDIRFATDIANDRPVLAVVALAASTGAFLATRPTRSRASKRNSPA